jgi:hypothetical protein
MIPVTIDFDERRLIARFEEFTPELEQALVVPLTRLDNEMLAAAQAEEPVLTGLLQADTRGFVDTGEDWIRGRVRVLPDNGQAHNLKAAALEYGAHGAAKVGAHQMTLDHFWGSPVDPVAVMVAAYTRDVNITEIAFLRDAAAGMQAQFEAEIERVVNEQVKKFTLDL